LMYLDERFLAPRDNIQVHSLILHTSPLASREKAVRANHLHSVMALEEKV